MLLVSPGRVGRVGLTQGGGRAAEEFDPLTVTPYLWYDPSDLTTMFQNSNGTTAVTADGDPVGYIADKSGNGKHWIQATAAARPLYKTGGGLHWLQFDGTDDGLGVSTVALENAMTAIYGLLTSDTRFVSFWAPSGIGFGIAEDTATGFVSEINSGTPAYRVNNGNQLANDRDAYNDAVSTGSALVVEARSLDLSHADWDAGVKFGDYSTYFFTGRFYGLILGLETNIGADRTSVLEYMAAKTGATLA